MAQTADPYALNEDGTAKDPSAFKDALLADSSKMQALEKEPEVLKIVSGDDIHAFQELIKSVYQVCNCVGNIATRGESLFTCNSTIPNTLICIVG